VKNLGFLLDLVVILLIGNKITYINEHIKFKHFKEHDGPTFFATWLGKRKLWCFYCKKLGYVQQKESWKNILLLKEILKSTKLIQKEIVIYFFSCFQNQKYLIIV